MTSGRSRICGCQWMMPPSSSVPPSAAATPTPRTCGRPWSAMQRCAQRNKVKEVEPTPLCLMFGQGHQHFLERLSVVPRVASFSRGSGGNEEFISPTACMTEALFVPWTRPDATPSFRWDPHEDVRYALRATDPTTLSTKETTQHGANRLAAVGLTALTVVPERRAGKARLGILGGGPGPRWRLHLHVAALAGSDQPRDDSVPCSVIQGWTTPQPAPNSASPTACAPAAFRSAGT